MSGKRNVSVCRGYELANALYLYEELFFNLCEFQEKVVQNIFKQKAHNFRPNFEFGYISVEILQIYTVHNLPHRAQIMTTF